MGRLIQQPQQAEDRESNWLPIVLGVGAVVVVVGILALAFRSTPKNAAPPHPYANNVKLTDVKMSAADNFVGATVTYIEGTVSNSGDKTVIFSLVHVIFRNSLGEVAQAEDVPLRVLQTGGLYPDVVNLNASPLAPGQSKHFRLTFEHISADWDHGYPELQVTNVALK